MIRFIEVRAAVVNVRLLAVVIVLVASALVPAHGLSAETKNPYDAWYIDSAGLSRSNCTHWAWQRWYEVHGVALPRWGNAGEWPGNAASAGFAVSSQPQVGSIVVTRESPLGHVAFVEALDPNDANRFLISEYGYDVGVGRHERWLTTDGSLTFILPFADASSVSFPGDGTGGPELPAPDDGTAGP